MSFDQLPYRKIPIWENRRRSMVLVRLRNLLGEILRLLDRPDTVLTKDIKDDYSRSIILILPGASQFIRLAGLSTTVPSSQREYLSNRSTVAGIDAKLDLLEGFLWQENPGLRKQAVALVDQATGVYNESIWKALINTFNPFYWIIRLIEWITGWIIELVALIAQLPVRFFSAIFSIDQEEAVRSKVGRFFTGVSVLVQGLAALVFLLDHFGLEKGIGRWLGFK
jgi:hypothetical protein